MYAVCTQSRTIPFWPNRAETSRKNLVVQLVQKRVQTFRFESRLYPLRLTDHETHYPIPHRPMREGRSVSFALLSCNCRPLALRDSCLALLTSQGANCVLMSTQGVHLPPETVSGAPENVSGAHKNLSGAPEIPYHAPTGKLHAQGN